MNITETAVPLFVHTEYSLLSSTIKIHELVQFCVDNQIKSIAITDTHNLFGAVEFSLTCLKNKIKPIIGVRMVIEGNRELLVYVKNPVGYENLSFLLSQSYIKSSGNAYVTWERLSKKTEGLLAILLPSITSTRSLDDLKFCGDQLTDSTIEWYVGLEPEYAHEASYLSHTFGKQVIAVSEARFLFPEQEEAHDALLCIKNKTYVVQEDREKSKPDLLLLKHEEMLEKFKAWPFAVQNSVRIAQKCDFILEVSEPKLPKFRADMPEPAMLTDLALQGLAKMEINPAQRESYRERLMFELEVISAMQFAGYFLIVSDFVKFAKDKGIPVSLRGSGAGSLVARCIDITEIDPIQFELFFERFLNPGRVSMPDIDIDLSPLGREAVIDYVAQKYGTQSVAGIITFGSLASRAALKDVGRVLQVPYKKTDELSKKIQVLFGRPFTLDETYNRDTEFASMIDADESLQRVFRIAKQLEGLSRHVSAHAAGIVISEGPLYRYTPLYKDPSYHLPLTQYSMKYVEMVGLVKFDFLGVTALEIISQTVTKARENGIEIDLAQLPFNDEATFAFLRSGHTRGVFQFETPGMTHLIKEMEANCIEDLVATVALYRPGPMENIPTFIRYKKGLEKVTYVYPQLEDILKNTYGIIVYQEQILKIVQVIAGYTLAEADLLRRAIGKKILSEMEKHRQDFIERTHKLQGGDLASAERLFKLIETFANYGFNKAHAVAYAIVGYKGAYLKTHFQLYFLCVSMTAEQGVPGKVSELISEANSLGIKVLQPCINKSNADFVIESNQIRYSLLGIKNVGQHVVDMLVKHRPFSSLKDLYHKVNFNKREVESLIKAGALDCFKLNRGILFQSWKVMSEQKSDLLFDPEFFISESASWNELDMLNYQKEILGIYLEKNPVDLYPYKKLKLQLLREDATLLTDVVAVLNNFTVKITKTNKKIYICHFSDPIQSWEAMLLSEDLSIDLKELENRVIISTIRNNNGRKIIKDITAIDNRIAAIKNLYIKIDSEEELLSLREVLVGLRADDGVSVYLNLEELVFIGFIRNFTTALKQLENYNWIATL